MVRCCNSGRKINDLLPAIIIWCLWLLFSRQCVSWLFWAANLIRSFIQVWPSLWCLWLIREKKSSIVDCTCVYTFNITSLPALCNFSRGGWDSMTFMWIFCLPQRVGVALFCGPPPSFYVRKDMGKNWEGPGDEARGEVISVTLLFFLHFIGSCCVQISWGCRHCWAHLWLLPITEMFRP